MMLYEVDLRNRRFGSSVECILSTKDSNEAYECADEWNKKNVPDYDTNKNHDRYINGSDEIYAQVYETPYELVHGVGKYSYR